MSHAHACEKKKSKEALFLELEATMRREISLLRELLGSLRTPQDPSLADPALVAYREEHNNKIRQLVEYWQERRQEILKTLWSQHVPQSQEPHDSIAECEDAIPYELMGFQRQMDVLREQIQGQRQARWLVPSLAPCPQKRIRVQVITAEKEQA